MLVNSDEKNPSLSPKIPLRSKKQRTSDLKSKQGSACVKWMFTLNNYTEEDIKDILNSCETDKLIHEYIFATEVAPKTGTPHLQGYIFFGKGNKHRWSELGWSKRVAWYYVKKDNGCAAYCAKLKTKPDGYRLWTNIKKYKLKKSPLEGKTLFPWQQMCLDVLNSPRNNRDVIWLWSTMGSVGKSMFAKHLCLKRSILCCGGKSNDVLFAAKQWLDKNDETDFIIDIPRDTEGHVSYSSLEKLKNGHFFAGKFESDQCIVEGNPHIICFANFPPKLTGLSLDRWNIFQILDEHGNYIRNEIRVDDLGRAHLITS